jgi:ubiquinone/menaquinone biosynthesis C-methylase UbiE
MPKFLQNIFSRTPGNKNSVQNEESKQPGDEEMSMELQQRVMQYLVHSMTCNLMVLGEKLGLYKFLEQHGPCSAGQVAKGLSLNERYVAEWLRHQAANKIITTDDQAETFWLNEHQKNVLTREETSPFFALGALSMAEPNFETATKRLPEMYKSGKGLDFDGYGQNCNCGVCRVLSVWQRHFLVKSLQSVEDVNTRLEQGCMAADVGCGYGFAVNLIAEAFPKSTVHGYDIADISLAGGRAAAKENGLKNVEFINPGLEEEGMKKDTYEFVLTQDAIHDMSQPFEVMKNVCRAMKDGGIWIIGDMKCLESHGANVHQNPLAPMVYGFSCHVCLPSAMQGPKPAALGAMGLTESLLREKLMEAGFKSLEKLDFGHKMNQFWLVRK